MNNYLNYTDKIILSHYTNNYINKIHKEYNNMKK